MSFAPRSKGVSSLILVVLTMIAICLLWIQSRYDPGRWRAVPGGEPTSRSSDAQPRSDGVGAPVWSVPEGLTAASDWEYYDPQTLSDKIDGKAELYLPAGFNRLATRRFFPADDPHRWMELFIYDMGSPAGAFAVFSHQSRENRKPLDLTPDAYRAANGIFLAHGLYYLEIIASDDSPSIQALMEALARAFVAAHPAGPARTDERSLFPPDGRIADSVALTAANAFGFERLDNIYTARYSIEGQEATAFLSHRASEAQAAELARAFADYLISYGGAEQSASGLPPQMIVVEVLGTFDVVFNHGSYLAGVHEAASLEPAVALAHQLYAQLNGATP